MRNVGPHIACRRDQLRRSDVTHSVPMKFVHVVYRTRRFDQMVRGYQTVFGAKVQYQKPAFAFLTTMTNTTALRLPISIS